MTLGGVLALLCIFVGFLVGANVATWWFDATTWFIAAIAIALTLGGVPLAVPTFTVKRKAAE